MRVGFTNLEGSGMWSGQFQNYETGPEKSTMCYQDAPAHHVYRDQEQLRVAMPMNENNRVRSSFGKGIF